MKNIPTCLRTLPNGLRVIAQPCSGKVCVCGFAIAAGTRDERDDEQGIAHFTEHMLFKGTARRSAYRILDRMGCVGGEVNAYTTKEEIFVYAICLQKDYERAMELMCDMLFHSVWPAAEIDKERAVVLDEIEVYEDSPSDLIYDDFEKYLFDGHPFGRNILGDAKHLKRMKTQNFIDFTRRCFTTDRIVWFSMAPLSESRLDKLIDRYLLPVPDTSSASVFAHRTAPVPARGLRQSVDRHTHQAHVLYGNRAYTLFEDKRLVLYLLNNILGGPGMNSCLNNLLREHNGLVYTVESTANFYSDTGLFSIYFGSDSADVERCLSLIDRELKRFRETPLSPARLHAAKKQLFGQIAIASENKEMQALSMGKSMLYYNRFEPIGEFLRQLEGITAAQIQETADEVFDPAGLSLLCYR